MIWMFLYNYGCSWMFHNLSVRYLRTLHTWIFNFFIHCSVAFLWYTYVAFASIWSIESLACKCRLTLAVLPWGSWLTYHHQTTKQKIDKTCRDYDTTHRNLKSWLLLTSFKQNLIQLVTFTRNSHGFIHSIKQPSAVFFCRNSMEFLIWLKG